MKTLRQLTLIHGLNNLTSNGKYFKQCKSLTEDKVIQVDLDDQVNPKLISISESLSSDKKRDLISLIREYIDVFTWSMKICLVLTLKWLCIVSMLNWMLNW